MKTRMVEERIGEYLGPIDWSYDFSQHDWGSNCYGIPTSRRQLAMAMLRQLEQPGTLAGDDVSVLARGAERRDV